MVVLAFLLLIGGSVLMSCVAFLIGRCGRRLPVDGILPQVVHGARFGPDPDAPYAPLGRPEARWPRAS